MKDSNIVVYGAIAANVAIAVVKFIAASITGSSAMLSEGIHSAVDTINDALLLLGRRLSERKPTPEHPFGHGKELYFWGLIVAVLIFGLGGGVSAYEGILHMRNPEPMTRPGWNYAVLAAAALFEGSSLAIALRSFLREKGPGPFWKALHDSKDPTTYTVLAEDSAALVGIAIAAVGVTASHLLGQPWIDGAASVLIGLLLAGVAVLLIRESRGLLIGEGVQRATAESIRGMALETPGVVTVDWPRSMFIGADEVLLAMDVGFDRQVPAAKVAASIRELERAIAGRYPKIKRIYIEPRSPSEAAQQGR